MIVLRWIALVGALGPLVYYVLATYCTWDYFREARKSAPPDPSFHPPVSILKPVRGVDREAYENFASFCRLDYPEYEIMFAVGDREDEVIPAIEKLQQDFPERQIRLLTGAAQIGTNNKTNKLCQLPAKRDMTFLVISDSDARVDPDYLREMVGPLARPDVGAVTALFRGMTGGSFVSELDALGTADGVGSERARGAKTGRRDEICIRLVGGDDKAPFG